MRSSRMRDESIKDLHMGKSKVGTRGVIGVPDHSKERRARGKRETDRTPCYDVMDADKKESNRD